MTFTLASKDELIKACGVDYLEIEESFNPPGVITLHFYGVKWYSFLKKRKINSIKKYVDYYKPVTVLALFKMHKERKSA